MYLAKVESFFWFSNIATPTSGKSGRHIQRHLRPLFISLPNPAIKESVTFWCVGWSMNAAPEATMPHRLHHRRQLLQSPHARISRLPSSLKIPWGRPQIRPQVGHHRPRTRFVVSMTSSFCGLLGLLYVGFRKILEQNPFAIFITAITTYIAIIA